MNLSEKLAEERRGRLAAERLLELKQAELYAANRKLGQHARALSAEIVETRAVVETIRGENEKVKSDLTVATQNLEIAERRMWQSISSIQDGFAFYDNDDCLIAANTAFMRAFDGLDEIKPGVAYARVLQLLTEEGIVDTGEMDASSWRAHMLRLRQSGDPAPMVVRLWNDEYIKVVEHRGDAGDLVSMALNITETVRYERDLDAARIKAEASARAKSSFLANMSHEIRTPMNGVVGMAELLQDSELNDEQELYVDTIRNSAEALLIIINDILDYSKIDAEKMVLQNAPFDLEKSVHEVLMLLNHAAHTKNVALLIDYDLFLTRHFVGDAGRLRQVLTNLIGNAVKFTLDGHVLVRITGIPESDGETCFLHVAVEDTGIGIPDTKINHIFGEFTQVDDERNRQFEGTGLGLAISKRLVELMGGEIWVTSEENVGSCFGFRVPLKIAEDASDAPAPLPATLKRVMIVDDTPTNMDILKRQLLALGVEAVGFESAAEALPHVSEAFDLIISDHKMENMNGPQFIEAVRAQNNETPAIILSSSPGEIGADLQKHRISAILQRPLLRDKLLSVLRDLGADLLEAKTSSSATAEPETTEQVPDTQSPDPLEEPKEDLVTLEQSENENTPADMGEQGGAEPETELPQDPPPMFRAIRRDAPSLDGDPMQDAQDPENADHPLDLEAPTESAPDAVPLPNTSQNSDLPTDPKTDVFELSADAKVHVAAPEIVQAAPGLPTSPQDTEAATRQADLPNTDPVEEAALPLTMEDEADAPDLDQAIEQTDENNTATDVSETPSTVEEPIKFASEKPATETETATLQEPEVEAPNQLGGPLILESPVSFGSSRAKPSIQLQEEPHDNAIAEEISPAAEFEPSPEPAPSSDVSPAVKIEEQPLAEQASDAPQIENAEQPDACVDVPSPISAKPEAETPSEAPFVLESPLPAEPEATLPGSEQITQEPQQEDNGPRQMRVLTAEDNKTNQLVLRKMLKKLDIDLKFANDGELAVEAYKEFKPDLIFMDISMPRMDGKQATSAIRALEAENGTRTPIVALTAHALSGDDETILAAGLDSYLTKPFNKKLIIETIVTNAPEEAVPPDPQPA